MNQQGMNQQGIDQHIIAVGGGGFLTESEPGIDQYLLDQARLVSKNESPKIGFVATASGDKAIHIERFYNRFSTLDCVPSHLALFRRTDSVSEWIDAQDIIFVGGGNTKSMLAVWDTWDLDTHLRAALVKGTILSGISAGAICWFDTGVTDSWSSGLAPLDCLGLLPGSCCPHYSLDRERQPAYQRMIIDGGIAPGVAIDDGACLHFINGQAKYIVSGHRGASAYYVSKATNGISEVVVADVETIDVSSS